MAVNIVVDMIHSLFARSPPGVTLDSCQVTAMRRRTRCKVKLYRVSIEGSTACGPHTLQCSRSLVCKYLPDSEEQTTADVLFSNELAVYTRALPALIAFQACNMAHVTLPFRGVPACYLARSGRLVLEDLEERGFKMAPGEACLDHAHRVAALYELARFHALSLAMKRSCPHRFHLLVAVTVHDEQDTLSASDCDTDGLNCRSSDGQMAACVEPREPMSVLCHGDCSANHFLFRHSAEGDILETCMVGFQKACYASPVVDISSLLSCCSCQEPRSDCLLHMLQEYHAALSSQLKQLLDGFTQDLAEDHLLNPKELWHMCVFVHCLSI